MEPAYQLDYLVQPKRRHTSTYRPLRKRIPAPIIICVLAILFVSCAILYIGQQVTSMQLSVVIDNHKEQLDRLKQEQGYLVIELEGVSRLEYIESIARQELGMVEPTNAEMLVMYPEQVDGYSGNGWFAMEDDQQNSFFATVANWLNQWLPSRGVEAGKIGK